MTGCFDSARGGDQTFHRRETDLNQLYCVFLERFGDDVEPVKKLVNQAVSNGGWLVFATHDVDSPHTRYGCSPDFFRAVVNLVAEAGAEVRTVGQVVRKLATGNT
jgi:hypothetical protein